MKVRVSIIGVLDDLPRAGETVIEADNLTVSELLDTLVERHGPSAATELLDSGRLRKELSLLVNGRNVLSLPEKFQAKLHDGDEVVITVQVSGG